MVIVVTETKALLDHNDITDRLKALAAVMRLNRVTLADGHRSRNDMGNDERGRLITD